MAALLNDDTTAAALEHRFRPIKKDGQAMKDGFTPHNTTTTHLISRHHLVLNHFIASIP